MARAIELAKKGIGFVNPNPLVGAVIVKNGKIIGEGFHEKYGELHAERNALKNCTENPCGAQMYVTLEPCCHYGKNPPCTDAVIESGIKKVYVGSSDPNPLVAGKGIRQLREHGIEVVENVMRSECDAINDIFFHFITTNEPYLILKTAATADGKTATVTGSSKWITNEKSRRHVHETRKRAAAILTGIGTVLADNPMLDCRIENPSNPVRFIADSGLRIPLDSRIVQTAREIPTYVAAAFGDREKEERLKEMGVNVIYTNPKDGHVDFAELIKKIGDMKLDSVLTEGGAAVNTALIKSGKVNKLQIYTAPKITGGDGKNIFDALGITDINNSVMLKNPMVQLFDDDILTEYEVIAKCLPE